MIVVRRNFGIVRCLRFVRTLSGAGNSKLPPEKKSAQVYELDGCGKWQPQKSQLSISPSQLANDLFMKTLCRPGPDCRGELVDTMHRQCSAVMDAKSDEFTDMLKKLKSLGYKLNPMMQIGRDMFDYGDISWQRIVIFHAVAMQHARDSVDLWSEVTRRNGDGSPFREVASTLDDVAHVCDTYLSEWVEKQGGWDGVVEHFAHKLTIGDIIGPVDAVVKHFPRRLMISEIVGLVFQAVCLVVTFTAAFMVLSAL